MAEREKSKAATLRNAAKIEDLKPWRLETSMIPSRYVMTTSGS
jgi:hypothetical protein